MKENFKQQIDTLRIERQELTSILSAMDVSEEEMKKPSNKEKKKKWNSTAQKLNEVNSKMQKIEGKLKN